MKAFYELKFEQDREKVFAGAMTQYPYPLHVHEKVEMAMVLSGSCSMQVDGRAWQLSPGDVTIAFPLVPHSYETLSPDCRGFAAIFPADMVAEYSSVFHTQLPDNPVVRREQLPLEARQVVDRLMEIPHEEPSHLRQAYLHLLLAHVLHGMTFHPAAAYNERGLGARVVRYVYEHACESITISSAARSLGISESHLSHLFAQQFKVNFRSFINAIRIDKATMLMRDPFLTLTQIYYQCGYDNMRTFRRAFVQEMGMLPGAYMRTLRKSITWPNQPGPQMEVGEETEEKPEEEEKEKS